MCFELGQPVTDHAVQTFKTVHIKETSYGRQM